MKGNFMCEKKLLAHLEPDSNRKQLLSSHSENAAALCSQYGKKIGMKNLGRFIGLLHDSGKGPMLSGLSEIRRSFQTRADTACILRREILLRNVGDGRHNGRAYRRICRGSHLCPPQRFARCHRCAGGRQPSPPRLAGKTCFLWGSERRLFSVLFPAETGRAFWSIPSGSQPRVCQNPQFVR